MSSGADAPTAGPASDGSGGPLLDVGLDTDGRPPGGSCEVVGELDATPPCSDQAPPDSFSPVLEWSWDTEHGTTMLPLVANFTDDNGDGAVDLCDTPDVLTLRADPEISAYGQLVLLDGETGAEHFTFETPVSDDGLDQPILTMPQVDPAIGDIDGDGLVEVVGVGRSDGVTEALFGRQWLVAWAHDGSIEWITLFHWEDEAQVRHSWPFHPAMAGAVALGDLDADGDVEIAAGIQIADHEGNVLWETPDDHLHATYGSPFGWAASALFTLADLDGDSDLEVVAGRSAYHHDGSEYYSASIPSGFPHVADFDGDDLPEVLITAERGHTLLEHDGTVVFQHETPVDPMATDIDTWVRPAAVHDLTGDGLANYAVSAGNAYGVFDPTAPALVWSSVVVDITGSSSGTAFDFLGDGVARAVYSDEENLHVYDGAGQAIFSLARSSWTNAEYPVVADVDNDGSAEILVVSTRGPSHPITGAQKTAPTLQVFGDAESRWVGARRIWNQHTYHVTNVREDGTIPQVEPPHWLHLNTFRTQAQLEGGQVCAPRPEG